MKRVLLIVAAIALLAAAACEKYDDGRPSKDVRSEFSRMYPDAWDVEWDYEGTCWEVSFETGKRPNGIDHTALYGTDGTWISTSTDILLSAVPEDIRNYLATSEFGTARIIDNDAEYIETPSGNFYRFDMSAGGERIEVDVNENGDVSLAGYGF